MDRQRAEFFLMDISKKMPPARLLEIENMVMNMDESQFMHVAAGDYKDPTTMLLISIFVGEFGVDRFMLGDIGMGVLKLLTGGVCGVLWIIDIINSGSVTREYNYKQFMDAAHMGSYYSPQP